ncbi:Guanine nucleotide exchange factor for Cdc42p [Coemansia aciculifera]|uniref:Guanine nucleotide exchange factor for Cdc42p n=1 Tax=Coemansia aciculifera TaxID=417176 RepID=A0ACC1M1E1_9FUNG|nr:Guanine nucleotide exchange factor for Cdc42p [Coemansia aciculifera]
MDELQKKNIIPNESVRYIFANLNSMVDFQRRFLIGVEANVSQPPEDQHFGAVFVNMKEGFMVYEPYCANYTRASKLCIAEEESLKALSHIIEPHYELPSMLIKPVQRICKYPMIMEELTKFYDKSSPIYAELREGITAINSIVEQVNEAERKEGNLAVVGDLEDRVEDWKGYSISTFGELFLHDSFVMSTTDVKRELLIYLFENILICCKEVNEKERRRNQKHKSNALQLKGRIFLFSIHSVVDTSRDGQLSLTIYWRDVVMENFSLACRTEDQLKLWKSTMERLITRTRDRQSALEQPQGSPTTLVPQRNGSNQQYGTSYDSEEEVGIKHRGRYSEGSSLTLAMQQDKTPSSLSYRKTYDGAASRGRGNAKKLAGDYQSELVDGIERSATISTFHRRQGTNGSGSSFGDSVEPPSRNQSSPMQSGTYYGKHDVPPVPVPPFHRSAGDTVGRMHSQKGPGHISITSPIPTAFLSSNSPVTPGVLAGVGGMSALSNITTPVPLGTSSQSAGTPGLLQAKPIKVKVHFQDDIFVIVVKHDVHLKDLVERVERKIKICAGPRVGICSGHEQDLASAPPLGIRMKYQDEDGDLISIGFDEDVQLAFESANASRKDETVMSTLNLFVTL